MIKSAKQQLKVTTFNKSSQKSFDEIIIKEVNKQKSLTEIVII